MSVGRGEDDITLDLGVDDLGDDVLVGEADDETVLGAVVLVLGLGDEALSGVVVGLALSVVGKKEGTQSTVSEIPILRNVLFPSPTFPPHKCWM